MDYTFFASTTEKRKSEDKSISHPSCIPILPLSSRKAVKSSTNSPHPNKGFINDVFCRNWAVRNPAGTRPDSSSLVNKQV